MNATNQSEKPALFLVINLEKDSKKLEKSLLEAKNAEIKLIRISAINGASLFEKSAFGFTKEVEACWASHLSAYKYLLSTEYASAIIFEDDFKIENCKNIVEVIHEFQKRDFDLLQLGFLSIGIRVKISQMLINLETFLLRILSGTLSKISFFSRNISRRLRIQRIAKTPKGLIPNDFQPGAHAYIISRQLANEIVSNYSNFMVPTDGFLQILAQSGGITSFRVRRSLVSQHKYADSMRLKKERI